MNKASFRGDRYFLSNFYPCKFEYNGIEYQCSEAAYQAQKFSNKEIFSDMTAKEAKRYSATTMADDIRAFDKVTIMKEILYCKFTQNKNLKKKLLDTGDEKLVEYNSWHDTYWGVDANTNKGQNKLGKILMEIRSELKEKQNE